MRRFFFAWLASALVALTLGLAGCGGGSGDSTSGLPASEKLVDLTDGEKAQLCDWAVAKFGGYGSTCNSDWSFMTYPDQASCVADSPNSTSTPDCDATVAQMEACINSLPQCATSDDFVLSLQCVDLATC